MICDSLKECIEKTQYSGKEEKSRKRGKKGNARKTDRKATDSCPMSCFQSPCGSRAQQEKCFRSVDCRSQIVCEDRGKAYTLDQREEYPRHEVINLRIDGGAVTDENGINADRCDFAIIVRENNASKRKTAILVELKGVSVRHALKQLMATLKQPEFQKEWKTCDRMFGRIVCTSVPRAMSNDARVTAMKEFVSRGGNLVIKEQSYPERYKELAGK